MPYKISMLLLIDMLILNMCSLILSETGYFNRYFKSETSEDSEDHMNFFEKVPFFIA